MKQFRNIVGSLAIKSFVENEQQLEDDLLRDREALKLFCFRMGVVEQELRVS